jgi:DNA-binding beta-propeller fold protein YncE
MSKSITVSRRIVALGLAAALTTTPFQVAVAQATRTYEEVIDWAELPSEYVWQDMMAVDIDSKGDIYVLQRTPFQVMVFNSKGKFLRSWNNGSLPKVHGLRIDRDDNVWITDRGLHQVLKYTRDGKLLMELGTRGVAGDNDSKTSLNGPADVAVAPNGDIFVADGEGPNTRIVKYRKDGTLLKMWGSKGSDAGQLLIPHSVFLDSRGKLYVANRGNKRIEIFDQEGAFLGQITNAATPYGLFITRDNTLFVADGTDGSEGVTVLNSRNAKVLAKIGGLKGSHMLTVDRKGAIYIAQVRGKSLRKFVRK